MTISERDIATASREDFKGDPTSRLFQREVFTKDQDIIVQGQPGNRAFYIEQGEVDVLMSEGGHEVVISTLGPGTIFGEMALVLPGERSATVRARGHCVVTVITALDLEKKIKKVDRAMAALMTLFVKRLRDTDNGLFFHYKNLVEFQDRIQGVVQSVSKGVPEQNRDKFRDEVTPLLEELEAVLKKYK